MKRTSLVVLLFFACALALAWECAAEPKEAMPYCPWKAVGRVQYEGIGSSATAIAPRRPDGQWEILGAAHAVGPVGSKAKFRDKAGKDYEVVVLAKDARSDAAWLVTTEVHAHLESAELAEKNIADGLLCWHCGTGTDKPGNKEEGEVISGKAAEAGRRHHMAKYHLSVSFGDAGGAIFDRAGKVVGLVCMTTEVSQKATVYGATVEQIRAIRPRHAAEPDAGLPAPKVLPPLKAGGPSPAVTRAEQKEVERQKNLNPNAPRLIWEP